MSAVWAPPEIHWRLQPRANILKPLSRAVRLRPVARRRQPCQARRPASIVVETLKESLACESMPPPFISALSTFVSARAIRTGPARVELASLVILRPVSIARCSQVEAANQKQCIAKRCLARGTVVRYLLALFAWRCPEVPEFRSRICQRPTPERQRKDAG